VTEPLRVSRSHFPVTALGPGVRFGVWVQGCPLACRGCMSLDTWDPDAGRMVDPGALADDWREAIGRGATGLTVSGGEPLAQPGPLGAFLEQAHRVGGQESGEYDILMFTGYDLEELTQEQKQVAAYADVLVTGRYEAGQPTKLIWRGSANQQMLLQSELGRERYTAHLAEEPANPPLQVRVDGGGGWIVGVPRQGTLSRLDREFRRRNLIVDRVSWRPSSGHAADGR
jgi:anaerobic ribonucleoside-triphosphate reductase activating protein